MRRLLALVLAVLVCGSLALFAQVTTGSITGTVTDSGGAVVPGAKVTVTNTATGLSRVVETNAEGYYLVPNLPPGTYTFRVEKSGFATAEQKDVGVLVGQTVNLRPALKPGAATEIVEVTAEAPLVDSTRSDLGGVVTPREVEALPLLNRTFAGLAVIMPEARPVGNFDPTKTRVGTIAFNGGDGRQVDVNVDGGGNKDNVVGSLLQNFSYESIQEFQVLQHRWTAESGRSVGGVVNVITKSGSNGVHGSFFANFRDEALRKFDFFENRSRKLTPAFKKPPYSRQEIGGSLGGPFIADKWFYFGALERFRERSTNVVPANLQPQLAAIPGATPVNEIPTPYDDWLLTAKTDIRPSSRHSISLRYAWQKNASPNDQIAVPATADLTGGNTNENMLHSGIFNHTWTIANNKVNQFVFHGQDFNNAILAVTDRPNIVFPSVQTGQNANVPQATLQRNYQFRDDFSWTVGQHAMKFGANYIRTKMDGFFFFGVRGHQVTFFDDPLTIRNNTNGLYPQGFAQPGAVRRITFSDGRGDHRQTLNQLAFYFQDDWKIGRTFTLNLGVRWDANIGNLPDQTNNRTILLLKQLNEPRARAITGDADKLSRTTPSWTEFQPRLGFAWDPRGNGTFVVRGGYGIFYDQVFQNLTLFSLTQSNPELFQTALDMNNSAVGVGQLSTFQYCTTAACTAFNPLPQPPAGFSFADLAFGGFGRINDPNMSEPYIQKSSIGFETKLWANGSLSSDYVHSLGIHESRVQVINPQIRRICDANYTGSNPSDPRCVRGASSRYFDSAFIAAGFGLRNSAGAAVGPCTPPIAAGSPCLSAIARVEQINMIGTTNRSLFDSWSTTLKHRSKRWLLSASYILANSRSWGGQPVASYSGNGIAVTPEDQFRPEEFGPTRIDERHRFVMSGVFDLPWGFQFSPIMQLASSRPYSVNSGVDLNGDGLSTNDRICANTDVNTMFTQRGSSANVLALNTRGCTMLQVNTMREGIITDPITGTALGRRSGRYFNVDLRATKAFKFGERVNLKAYADFFNLFNTENLSYGGRLGLSNATSRTAFLQPVALYGPGFGPPVGRPLTMQLGFRLDF